MVLRHLMDINTGTHLVLPWMKLNHEKRPDDAVCTSCLTSPSGTLGGSLRMTTFFLSMSHTPGCHSHHRIVR